MEILIVAVVAVVLGGVIYYVNQKSGKLDVNQDGKVDAKDAKVVVEAVKSGARAGAAKAKREVKKATGTASKKRNFTKKPKAKA